MKKSSFNDFLIPYLKERQLFYAFLRPQEALLYQKYLPFKKPVLDFGCGDGFFASVAFEEQGKIEVGLDMDPKIKKEAEDSGIYKKVIIYNGQKVPLPDDYFSTIVSNCVLEHISNLKLTLKELNRVLKRGGRMYLTVVTDQWQKNLFFGKIFGEIYQNWFKKIQNHYNLFSQEKWEKMFQKAGYTIKREIPYMSKRDQQLCEIFHYLFLAYPLLRKVLKPSFFCPNSDGREKSLIFFVLKK